MVQEVSGVTRRRAGLVVLAAAVAAAGCDKAQLLAPTKSTISISAPTRVLPTGGTTDVTALVVEEAGTPVGNGTTVRFSTSLGRVSPVEAQTRNGVATTTFFAETTSGVARITAVSGAASGGTGNGNVVEITIGAAAVNTVTLRANPGSVGPLGGEVELVATVVADNGRTLDGIGVVFNTDQGTLSASMATTDANGQARVTLTTTQKATVSATAGTKTSSNVTVDLRAGPLVSISCTPTSGTGNCAAVQASATSNTVTVLFTAKKVSGSSTLRTSTIDFGDGTSQALGNLAADATITHTYAGPADNTTTARSFTATVQATDINGESSSASTIVMVTPKPTITPMNVTISATGGTATSQGQRWEFTATVTGGGESGTGNATIQQYRWDFGDGDLAETSGATTAHIYTTQTTEQRRTVVVTARAQDGRNATGRTEILVAKFP